MTSIVEELQKIVDQYELENKAYKYCLRCMKSEDSDLHKDIIDNIKIRFRHHKFCFKHGLLDYVYIETCLDLIYGEVVDDSCEIHDNIIELLTDKEIIV